VIEGKHYLSDDNHVNRVVWKEIDIRRR